MHEYSTDEVLLEANPGRRDGASGVGFIRCAAPACLDSLEQQQRPCPCARALEIEFEGTPGAADLLRSDDFLVVKPLRLIAFFRRNPGRFA